MPIIFDSKDSVFFVGGRGAKTGDQYAGGGCTKDFWGDLKNPTKTLADVMDANGLCLSSELAGLGDTSCDVVNNGSGKVRITKVDQGYFSNCVAGLVARIVFAATYTSGRYEVIDADDDWIDIDETYSADTTCSARVGGAFDKLQHASDNTDANSTTPHGVYILTNKDETFSAAGDQIDIDTGGGDIAANTFKRIIGIDGDGAELAVGSYVTIDGNGQSCHCIYVDAIVNVEFRHIYAKDANSSATYYGFRYSGDAATTYYGHILRDCKSTGCKCGIGTSYRLHNLFVEGGYYESSVSYAINTASIMQLFNVVCKCVNYSTMYVWSAAFRADGCVFCSGPTSAGILIGGASESITIVNCIFYDVAKGIEINCSGYDRSGLVEFNNICVLHAKATSKFINRILGSIAYSDYSCLWASDGAPSASGRWGGSGKPEHAIEEDPDFIDAANGNFRPRNPNVLRGGKPDIADNATEMGAVLQKYQFARRAKAANFGRLQIVR